MSEEGDTYVIEAANEYRLVRKNSLDFSMATPAIVGDRLLIRTQHRLWSIRETTPEVLFPRPLRARAHINVCRSTTRAVRSEVEGFPVRRDIRLDINQFTVER